MAYSTDIKDYYRRAWGLGDRVPFKYGGTWADWKVNYEDQMSFEEYLQDDKITKKLHALDKRADGGRIGLKNGSPEKYVTPLRREGFTGSKFTSVDDPTYSDGRRRVKTKAYEKWLKAEHAKNKPDWRFNRTVRPELDKYLIEIAEAIQKADNTQDFEYLMRNKEGSLANEKYFKKNQRIYKKGMLSNSAITVLKNLETNPVNLKIIADSLGEDTDWVLNRLDERNQYVEDVKGERATAKKDPRYIKPRNDYLKVENWLQKNAKKYSTPQAFEKALIKRFGNKNQFIMDMKSPKNSVTTYFSPEFKKLMLNSDSARTMIKPSHLKQLISSSLYNYNDKIKTRLTNEIRKIFTSENLPKLRTEARKMIRNNHLFKMFGLDKTITGPFPRVIQAVIGEKLWKDFRAFRHPRVTSYELLKAFEDLVPQKFKGMFSESAKAVLHAQNNLWPAAKKNLGIADKIAWDHKVPSSIIDKGYADIVEYTKVNPVDYEWNARIKNAKFDSPINKLILKFEKEKTLSGKKKIYQQMLEKKNKFSKTYGGYLDEIDINFNERTGKLKFSSSAKPLTKKMDMVKMLETSQKQVTTHLNNNPKLKTTLINKVNSGIPVDDITRMIAQDLKIPAQAVGRVLGKVLKVLGPVGWAAEPVFAAINFSEAIDEGLSGKQAAAYTVGKFGEDVINLPGMAVGAVKWGKGKLTGEDTPFKTPYEFTFARDWKEKTAEAIPENVKLRRKFDREFDNTIGWNMTMVDYTDMPASRNEVAMARDTFLKEKLGENYQVTHPKDVEKEKLEIKETDNIFGTEVPTKNLTGVDIYKFNRGI